MFELHPLPFFLPKNAKVLFLGSFPPTKNRWSMDFYYPNLQNDMWRIIGLVFFNDKNHFLLPSQKAFDKEKIIAFLEDKGIALGDTAVKVHRAKNNSSDNFLEVVEAIDLEAVLLSIPHCYSIVTTGGKATEVLASVLKIKEPSFNEPIFFDFLDRKMSWYRLPSTSRAYPKSLDEKVRMYKKMLEEVLMKEGR
ncbi:MAG TPA: uracil-DNA glycosylase family protein [Bacteroidales bacterium]|nr:uracil-DNA glycosylase family protein [Bacteroidales bacterium]HQB20243.1 uracil-DNA glycosylase family protein [Bacteroidales bacterium]